MTSSITYNNQGLYEIFADVAERFSDKVAVTYFGMDLTYKQLKDRIDATALAFKQHGIGHGDIVSISLPTMPESLMCFYALNKIGAVPCMIDIRYTAEEFCKIIDRTQSKLLFVMGHYCVHLAEAEDQLNVNKVVVCSGADSIPGVSKWYALGEWFNGRRRMYRRHKKFFHWNDFYKTAQGKDESEPYHWAPEEMVALFHTSGTTGTVKSVMLSTENILHSVFPDPPVLNDMSSDDTALCFLPIFAFFGANTLMLPLCQGMHVIVMPILPREELYKLLVKHKPQHVFTVPSYWDFIDKEKDNKKDLSFIKSVNIAGDVLNASFEKSINEFLHERNCRYDVTKAYGMTETAGIVAFTPQGSSEQYKLGFSGQPVSVYEVKTFDDEICIRSKMRMLGYFQNEEATRQLFQTHPDGSQWIHTGDIGYVDEHNNVFVIGRKKRMIVRYDGSKVFPIEIENCLMENDLVASCAVVAIQDPAHSESKLPKAFVVLKEPHNSNQNASAELMRYCKNTLPEHLVPTAIEIIDEMPVNGNGKVDYKKLASE